jgi:hypothetical protein
MSKWPLSAASDRNHGISSLYPCAQSHRATSKWPRRIAARSVARPPRGHLPRRSAREYMQMAVLGSRLHGTISPRTSQAAQPGDRVPVAVADGVFDAVVVALGALGLEEPRGDCAIAGMQARIEAVWAGVGSSREPYLGNVQWRVDDKRLDGILHGRHAIAREVSDSRQRAVASRKRCTIVRRTSSTSSVSQTSGASASADASRRRFVAVGQ